MPTWETQGTHRLYCEEDLFFYEIHGVMELGDSQRMYVISEAIVKTHGYILTLFDARAATGISAEARRHVGAKAKEAVNEGAAAVVGASFALRAVVMLLRNASRLVGQRMTPMQFFANPADGLRWLGTQRELFRAKLGRPDSP